MKKFTLLFICCINLSSFSQDFIAGDTTQPGIVYVDIDDIILYAEFPNGGMGYDLIIDDTGLEVHFDVSASSSMGHTSEYSTCSVFNGEIAYLSSNEDWVLQIDAGYDISSYNLWGDPSMLRGYFSDPYGTTYYGVFNSGYIGFKFSMLGEIYFGWIRAHVSSGYIKIYDYAYQDFNYITEIGDLEEKILVSISPNPFTQCALVEIDETIKEWTWILYDSFGKPVQIIPTYSNSQLQISRDNLKAGIYIYLVRTKKGMINSGKLLIQ